MAFKKMTQKEKREYMAAKEKDCIARLTRGIEELIESEAWEEWLRFQARFHSYSFSNVLLILRQCPNATAVGGYKTVWEPLGYRIKKNVHAIAIWGKPWVKYDEKEGEDGEVKKEISYSRYPILSVYDISQLEPGPDAKPLTSPAKVIEGADHEADLTTLVGFANQNGIEVKVGELPGNMGGRIRRDGTEMTLNEDRELNHRFRTVAHELAHFAIHRSEQGSRETEEMDAEAVAFIVADARGLDTAGYSTGYIASWVDGDVKKFVKHMKERGEVIAKAAKWILSAFDGKGEKEDE